MYRQRARADLQEKARKTSGIGNLTFQMCRRTFSTLIKPYAETRDIQAMLGHARASTALEHYIQPVTESQRAAVERLANELFTTVH
jgi:integrase